MLRTYRKVVRSLMTQFDYGSDGTIQPEELYRALKEYNPLIRRSDVDKCIVKIDVNHGKIKIVFFIHHVLTFWLIYFLITFFFFPQRIYCCFLLITICFVSNKFIYVCQKSCFTAIEFIL